MLGFRIGEYTRVHADAPAIPNPTSGLHDNPGATEDAFDIPLHPDDGANGDGDATPVDDEDDEAQVTTELADLRERRILSALGHDNPPASRSQSDIDATRCGFERLAAQFDSLAIRARAQAPFAEARFLSAMERHTSTSRAFGEELAALDRAVASTGPRPRTWGGTGRTMFYRPVLDGV
jgi:hypothetical protein